MGISFGKQELHFVRDVNDAQPFAGWLGIFWYQNEEMAKQSY